MARKNVFVRVGRPPGSKNKIPAQPKFDSAVPAKAFRRGGSVSGYARTASHHDDSALSKSHSEMGYASCDQHFKRLAGK